MCCPPYPLFSFPPIHLLTQSPSHLEQFRCLCTVARSSASRLVERFFNVSFNESRSRASRYSPANLYTDPKTALAGWVVMGLLVLGSYQPNTAAKLYGHGPVVVVLPYPELLPLLRPASPVARMLRARGLWRNAKKQ